jgi:multidrug efflux pump subunit AcrA (membrane-fusion protein)
VSKISLEITRLNLESAQYEADITRQEIQLSLEQAEISLQQAEEQIENTRRTQKEERYQKELSIHQSEKELQDANSTLEKLVVKAPSAGIVMIRTNYSTQAKYQEGESVWSGQQMIELPNLRELKVNLKVNEVDISKVKKGLKVMIRPDAFADSTYWGEVQMVANLAVNKSNNSKIKVFPVEVLITSPVNQDLTKDPELMPGLTVSCRIIVDEIPDQIFIPQTALFQEDGKDVVYVKTASGFRTKEVELGQRNTDYVIVKSGLKAKEQLALMYPYPKTEEAKNEKEAAE